MTIELNKPGLAQARRLVREGKVVRDERGAWSEAAPSPEQENTFVAGNGWTAFSHWHLGVDRSENAATKGAYSFPYGDFHRVHRSGVIAAESRAGQFGHIEIRDELRRLLELIDTQ